MTTLTNTDYQAIAQIIRSDTEINQTFKTWSLSKATWKSLFQAAETFFVGAFSTTPSTSFKAALDAVTTTTATQAKWVWKIWSMWRIGITW